MTRITVCFAAIALGCALVSGSSECGVDDTCSMLQFAPAASAEAEMKQELNTIEVSIARARDSAKSFVTSTSGLQQVQLNRGSELSAVVAAAFPTASCIGRTSSLKKIPMHIKDQAGAAPQMFGDFPKDCAQAMPSASSSAPALCVFSHAVANAMGDVCDSSGCLVKPSENSETVGSSFVSCDDLGCSKANPEKDSAMHDAVYVISQHNDGSLSNFMEHGVLRLLVGLDYLLGAGKSTPILVRQKSDEIVNVMKLFGIGADRLITGDVRARALIYPEAVHEGTAPRMLTQLARWTVRQHVPVVLPIDSHNRLPLVTVVRRSSDSNAHLSNHDELVAALTKELKGYHVQEIDNLQNIPAEDAMRLFATSAVVVAPHGAGLYNLLAANPGGAVVEIMPGNQCNSVARPAIGQLLGLNYHMLYTDKAAYDGTMKADKDIVLPVVRVALQSIKL